MLSSPACQILHTTRDLGGCAGNAGGGSGSGTVAVEGQLLPKKAANGTYGIAIPCSSPAGVALISTEQEAMPLRSP